MEWISNRGLQLWVLGLIYVTLVVANTCPYTHPNCKCVGNSVTCTNLQTIPPLNTGSGVIAVDTVEFEQGRITTIPENSLPAGLVHLAFRENPLTNITDDALTTSSTTLKELSIRNAQFNRIPSAFSKLASLEQVRLDTISITDWNSAALQNISGTLEALYLTVIDLWPQWVSECRSLHSLSLIACSLSTIPDDAFVSLNTTLTSFTARSVDFTQIPKALSSLRNLTTLEISGSHLDNVNGREGFEQVTSFPWANTLVKLRGNNLFLKSLPDLSTLNSVTWLDLCFNSITQVSSEMLPRNLELLFLCENNITRITDHSFTNLSKLERLDLGANPISVISYNAFNDLVSLKTLRLYDTRLRSVPLALVPLSGLTRVDMSRIPTLQCTPCPIFTIDLQFWFESYNTTLEFVGACPSQQNISLFLSGWCPQLTPTTDASNSSCDAAPVLAHSAGCSYLMLLLLHIFAVSE